MTIAELLREGAAALKPGPGLPDPAREVRWLLARSLGVGESHLLAHPEDDPGEIAAERFRSWVRRRAAGEPAHYLTGEAPFWGRDLGVTPAVLIPRPETELVVEVCLGLPLCPTPRVLDVGTGSGALAVTLALEIDGADVTACDISTEALCVARSNAARLGAAVRLFRGNLADACRGRFDLVVANLPYIPDGEIGALAPEIRDHEPALALRGGVDGTDLLFELLRDLERVLVRGGLAVFELGPGQAPALEVEARDHGLEVIGQRLDLGGTTRVVTVTRPRDS